MLNFAILVLILTSFLSCQLRAESLNESVTVPQNDSLLANERELVANEDPLTKQIEDTVLTDTDNLFELYGSIYTRYRKIYHQSSEWQDNGSRAGITGYYQTTANHWLFARYELGFNVLDEFNLGKYAPVDNDKRYILDGESVFTRLAYVGLQTKQLTLAYGKNWSTYYQVASFTDRFDSLGGEAHGVYNAGTDGGLSGTGRANNVLQSRLNLDISSADKIVKKINLNFQLQNGEAIPNLVYAKYGTAYGVSTIIETVNNLSLGLAYSRAKVDLNCNQQQSCMGLSGDMRAFLIGTQWYNNDWFIGLSYSNADNLHATDDNYYFSGQGSELYVQYQFTHNFWLLAGLNKLKPDKHQAQAENYQLDYTVFGLRYSFDGFARMLYIESRLDNGSNANGDDQNNQIILGLRWSI